MVRPTRYSMLGLSLVELMIAMLIGLILMAGTLTLYATMSKSTGDAHRATRMDQELRAVTNLMINDIRRAGHWNSVMSADPVDFEDIAIPNACNPFLSTGSHGDCPTVTDINVLTGSTVQTEGVTGDCVLYTYDMNANGILEPTEFAGFRLRNNSVQMRTSVGGEGSTTDCNAGSWQAITDPGMTRVTDLSFTLCSECINLSATGNATANCNAQALSAGEIGACGKQPGTPPATGERLQLTRRVTITIAGQAKADASVRRSLADSDVKLRNDYLIVTP